MQRIFPAGSDPPGKAASPRATLDPGNAARPRATLDPGKAAPPRATLDPGNAAPPRATLDPGNAPPTWGTIRARVTRAAVLVGVMLLALSWTAGAAPMSRGLSLEEAVHLALDHNIQVQLARERVRQAQAVEAQTRAGLLPTLSFSASQANVTSNLAAQGFKPGFFPGRSSTVVGPFYSFDARVKLVQSLVNQSAVLRARTGREALALARLQEELAREQVASSVEVAYIGLLRGQRAVLDAEADVLLATRLVELAERQRNAGVATGLDVIRARARLAQDEVKLAQSHTSADQSQLQLQHLIGTPMGERLQLTDTLRYVEGAPPSLEDALATARRARLELQVAREQLRINELEVAAARAEYLPTLGVAADYGWSGESPASNAQAVHNVALQVSVPIFNGGLTRSRVLEAQSRARQAQLQLSDVDVQVEQDVRSALDTLRTTTAQVQAAELSVELAERELKMAQDRFGAGLGDNIELVTAQTALASARDARAGALAQHHVARINFAAALGRAQQFQLVP